MRRMLLFSPMPGASKRIVAVLESNMGRSRRWRLQKGDPGVLTPADTLAGRVGHAENQNRKGSRQRRLIEWQHGSLRC